MITRPSLALPRALAVVGALVAAAPAVAHATPSPAESAPTAPKEPLVKLTTIAMPHPNVPEETMVSVMRGLETALKTNKRLEVKDVDARVADFESDQPTAEIEASRTALKEGQAALGEQKIAVAIGRLEEAVTGLARVLPYIKKQELADAMAALAVAYYEKGDKQKGHAAFVRLLTWRADYTYDATRFPSKYLDAFDAAQKDVGRLKAGALRLTSDPAGAQAYVDGKYYGVTPCAAEGLRSGEHFVTLKKEGFKKTVQAAHVVAGKETQVDQPLAKMEKYLLVEQAVQAIDKNLGTERATDDMDTFKQVLFMDQAVFVRARPKAADTIDVDAYLYDLRTRLRLTHVVRPVRKAQLDEDLAAVARDLYLNVSYSGELVAPKEKDLPQQERRAPVYKTWWFWTAAAAVVVGAAGAGAAIYLTRPNVCQDGDFCPVIKY